jgi:hypothetical protein
MEPLEMESVVPVEVGLPREAKMLRGLKEPFAGGAACCVLDGKGNIPDSTSLVDLVKLPLPLDHGRAAGEIGSPALSSCSIKKSVLLALFQLFSGLLTSNIRFMICILTRIGSLVLENLDEAIEEHC